MGTGQGGAARRVRLFWRINVVAYLTFFAVPVTDLVRGRHGTLATAAGAVALAAFVGVYLWTAWGGVRPAGQGEPWPALLACGVIAVATTATLGPAWGGLLTYVAYLAGGTIRRLRVTAGVVLAVTTCVAVFVATRQTWQVPGAWVWIGYVLFVGAYSAAIAWLYRTCEELDRARADAARLAVADERIRFARDLHDLLGHSLSVIALKSELAGRLAVADPERTAAELRDIETVTRQALAEVRAAVTGYRVEGGLDAELERARLALTAAGVDARLDVGEDTRSDGVDELFAWTVREATTNVVRHADARTCTIRVHATEDGDRIEVTDDGVGAGSTPAGGQGLGGLTERVAAARGRVDTADLPDGGFRLVVEVPR